MTRALWILGAIVVALGPFRLSLAADATSGDVEKGRASYSIYCVTCHGERGAGDGVAAAALEPKPRDLAGGQFVFDTDADGQAGTDTDLASVIRQGAAAFGGSPLMTPWAHLPPDEVQNLVAFIRSLESPASTRFSSQAKASTP